MKTALSGYSIEVVKAAISQSQLTESEIKTILASKGLKGEILNVTTAELAQITANNANAASQNAAAASTGGFSLALKGLASSIGMVKLAIGGIAIVIGAVYMAFSKYKQHLEDIRRASEEAANTHKQAMETLASHQKTVDELSDAYNKLSKGVDVDTNQNLSLSDEEYQSYINTIKELVDIFPSLQTGLDENGNAILSLGKNGRSASEDLRELLKAEEELNNYKISQDIALLFANVKEAADEAVQATAKFEEVSSSMENAKQALVELSEEGIDLSNGAVKISGGTADEAGIAYYNAVVKSIQNFKDRLSTDRQIELSDILDISKITDIDENGMFDIYLDTFLLSEEEKKQLQNEIKIQTSEMMPAVNDALEEAFQGQETAKKAAELAWKDYVPYIVATMKSSGSFKELANEVFGEDLQNFAVDLVSGLDQSVSQEMDKRDPYAWVRENIIAPLTILDEDGRRTVLDAYNKLMELNPDDLAESNQGKIDTYVKMIAEMLGHTEAEVRLNFGFKVDDDLQAKYDTAISNAVSKFRISKKEIQGLFTELGIDTSSEIDRWNTVAMCADNATEAKKRYLETSAEPSAPPTFSTESFSKSVESLSELQNLYNDFYNDVNKDKIDFTFEIGDIEKLREAFGGVCQSFDEFEKLATSSSTTAEQMQNAFDRLATEFIVSGGMIDGLNSSTRDMIVSQMELQGIANASSIITEEVAKVTGLAAQQNLTLANAADSAFLSILNESNAGETTRMSIYALATAEIAYNSNGLDTSGKIAQLQALAQAYGDTASAALAASAASYAESMSAFHGGSYEDALETKYNDLLGMMGKFSNVSVKVGQSAANAAKSVEKGSKSKEKEVDIMAELIKEMGVYQDKLKAVQDARETYNEYGKISVDQAKDIVDADFKLLAAYGNEEGALEDLGRAKLNEMQIQLARNAIDTISRITSEAEATQYLAGANEHLVGSSLDATEAMLQQAVAAAKLRGELQGQAADTILKGYQNGAMMLGQVDFKFDPAQAKKEKEEAEKAAKDAEKESEKQFEKQYNWIERLLDRLEKITAKWKALADKFQTWWNKNRSLNHAIKATHTEISANSEAYDYYRKKAGSIGLDKKYRDLVENGKILIEDITDEELADKIDQYQEWYDKAKDVQNRIDELYDSERDLIRQKLDNVLDYYGDLDSYLSSVTAKMESLIKLNDEMGKRSSLTELVEQFAALQSQSGISGSSKNITEGLEAVTEQYFGDSKKVSDAVSQDNQNLISSLQKQIDNLNASQSGTYAKLLRNIEKTQAQIIRYEDNGWDVKKAKSYEKLKDRLRDYYDLQRELDEYATSNTIVNYEKVYTAYQKLQNKLDSGKALSKSEQKRYDQYEKQIEDIRRKSSDALNELYEQLGQATGELPIQSEADAVREEIEKITSDLNQSAVYQNLLSDIEKAEEKIAKLDEKGYDHLTKTQKKTYDRLLAQVNAYYAKKEELDEHATASNISEYSKIYDAWKKLQDRLDKGGNLTAAQWKQYEQYRKQLEQFGNERNQTVKELNDQLEALLSPPDKTAVLEREYENAAEGIYQSYQSQIDNIGERVRNTKQYQDLYAKARILEQKKDTKGLSKSEEATLNKYNEELRALLNGATSDNISDYISTWEKWYKLQQKMDSGKKLSAKEASNYDSYKALLEAWNKEKQSQIEALSALMQEELDALQKKHTENVSEAESEINDYYANLYALAKQIAEYNVNALKTQLSQLDAFISYYKDLVSLYDRFSDEKLSKLLTDLDEDALRSQTSVYEDYLNTLKARYDTVLDEISGYGQLMDAIDTNDFEASMELFQKAMEDYRSTGNTVMADKLQSVLDLLDKRAVSADDWGTYADEWQNEWEAALSAAKSELINTAGSIQEVNDALREIKFSGITDAIEELTAANDIFSSITSLIQDEWLHDKDGLSEFGQAKLALLVSQLENAQASANRYLELYHEIEENKDTYASDKDYQSALNEAMKNYYDSLNSAASFEKSILELMKKTKEQEISNLKEVIEARKKALQAKKDYYDYDKSLKSKTKDVEALRAQIDALNGIDTAEARARKAKLESDLADLNDELEEMKKEHEYELQIKALDDFSDSLSDTLEETAKDAVEILKEQKEIIDSATELYRETQGTIQETLDTVTGFYESNNLDIHTPAPLEEKSEEDAEWEAYLKERGLRPVTTREVFADMNLSEETLQRLESGDFHIVSPPINGIHDMMKEYMEVLQKSMTTVQKQNISPVVNIHYDNLINVEGSVDKDFAKTLKSVSKEISKNVQSELDASMRKFGWQRTYR